MSVLHASENRLADLPLAIEGSYHLLRNRWASSASNFHTSGKVSLRSARRDVS